MKRNIEAQQDASDSRFGAEAHFKGVLRFSSTLRISGKFQGEVLSGGTLMVDRGSEISANINAEHVIVAGHVNGNITAPGRTEIMPDARIYGNVRTGKLKIADGVVFEGKCEMMKKTEAVLNQ